MVLFHPRRCFFRFRAIGAGLEAAILNGIGASSLPWSMVRFHVGGAPAYLKRVGRFSRPDRNARAPFDERALCIYRRAG